MDALSVLAQRDAQYKRDLQKIGSAIGYGNAQHLLGELWDAMLGEVYGVPPGRGQMGVTIDEALPPLPKASKLRREMLPHGGYQMVPAYTVPELKHFAHAAIGRQVAWCSQALYDVTTERRRQVEAEGWTPQHDDKHAAGEMPHAAACYALMAGGTFAVDALWPKDWGPVKAKPQRRALVIAAALLLAEIERLDRAETATDLCARRGKLEVK